MALFERLVGSEEPKIGVHGFAAALRFWALGLLTRANIKSSFGLGVESDADFDWLETKYNAAADKVSFIASLEQLLILAEEGRFDLRTKATFAGVVDSLI